jgi:hypothetical protein
MAGVEAQTTRSGLPASTVQKMHTGRFPMRMAQSLQVRRREKMIFQEVNQHLRAGIGFGVGACFEVGAVGPSGVGTPTRLSRDAIAPKP